MEASSATYQLVKEAIALFQVHLPQKTVELYACGLHKLHSSGEYKMLNTTTTNKHSLSALPNAGIVLSGFLTIDVAKINIPKP